MLRSIGCRVESGNLVKIPARLVEQAIEWSPSTIPVYNTRGELQMTLEQGSVYFGAGGASPFMTESDGSQTAMTSKECAEQAVVADALENIDFFMAMAHCGDFPVEVRDVFEILTVLSNTLKPIVITSNTQKSLDVIVEMCSVLSGSKEDFLDKPYLLYYTEPVTPLQHTKHSLDKLLSAADYGLPILNTPAPMAGGTAPITLSGTLISGFAELLSGMVLVQNYKRGTPMIFGGVFTTLDMRETTFTYGSPELQLMNSAIAEMARFYKVPSFGTAGETDAHEIDAQAAFECGQSILLNALSGSNLVHDVGWLSAAQATSNELLVLCDEMIGYARRYIAGINTNRIEQSVSELAEVGPGGSFINRDMTFELFRKEVWYPTLMSRQSHKSWLASDKKPLDERLKDEVDRILKDDCKPAIEEARIQEMQKIADDYRSELGV